MTRVKSALLAGCIGSYLVPVMPASAEDQFRKVRKEGVEIVARNGMVVGTTGEEAEKIGLEILKQGGSAADAAIAAAMAQVVLSGGSWVSFAGIYGMVYYDAGQDKVFDLNAEYDTVAGETVPATIPGKPPAQLREKSDEPKHFSGRTVLVPGFMAGIGATHAKFGKLPIATVFEPVIRLAEQGFPLTDGLETQIRFRDDVLAHWPETRSLFQKNGQWLKAGDPFQQKELAATLRQVVQHGTGYMYTGAWAKKFVATVREAGGRITMDDMARYRPLWTEPLTGTYKGFKLFVHGLPATGGVNLIEALNALEASNLSRYGDFTKSPEALNLLSRVLGAHYQTAARPVQERLSKEHAVKLWQSIEAGTAAPSPDAAGEIGPRHSDGLVVVDRWGNIAAITHSINTVTWGEFGRFVDGVSVPDSASFQQKAVAAAGPGKRLPSPLEIGVVTRDARPFLGFASIGAGLHQKTVTSLYSAMELGQRPQQAINQPDIGLSLPQPDPTTGTWNIVQYIGAGEFPAELLQAATKNGVTFNENDSYRGYWVGISRDPADGTLYGGSLRRFNGRGVGY